MRHVMRFPLTIWINRKQTYTSGATPLKENTLELPQHKTCGLIGTLGLMKRAPGPRGKATPLGVSYATGTGAFGRELRNSTAQIAVC